MSPRPPALDATVLRKDFPILTRRFHGKPLVYLDSAATSQKPQSVIDAMSAYYTETNANVHRGVYALSEEATADYESARAKVAGLLHAKRPEEIVFLRGATEGLNLVATSLGRGALTAGDRVLLTVMEHHSNIVPWHLLRTYQGIGLDFLDIDDSGRLRLDELEQKLTPKTRVVSITHVSNVLGTVNPVREIADRAHDAGALVVVDAAQSVPHRRVDVEALGTDFLTFSGHKALGPSGIGVLWGRYELLEKMPPFLGGGEMIREVHPEMVTYREPPGRFEAGTPDIGGAHGLAAAVDYLLTVGLDRIGRHERALLDYAIRQCQAQFGDTMRIYGPSGADREAILSFSLRGVHPHDVASLLDAEGVAIRSGHHCAQPLMERLGVPALSRASFYLYNTEDDVDRFVGAVGKVFDVFGRPPP